MLFILKHGYLVVEVLHFLDLSFFVFGVVTGTFAYFAVRNSCLGEFFIFFVLNFVYIDQEGLAHEIVATDHEDLNFPEEIIDELDAHLTEVFLDIFVDFL